MKKRFGCYLNHHTSLRGLIFLEYQAEINRVLSEVCVQFRPYYYFGHRKEPWMIRDGLQGRDELQENNCKETHLNLILDDYYPW